MNNLLRLATALAAGAAIMYYFDPATGRRRRAMAREKGVSAGHEVEDFARSRSKRVADRLQGAVARTRARVANAPVDDDRLRERIRSRLGRLVQHPGAVEVQVRDGHVVLGGTAPMDEIDRLVEAVAGMPGVEEVDNRLSSGVRKPASGPMQDARH
jgi:osmotically-inducible protein OsmY